MKQVTAQQLVAAYAHRFPVEAPTTPAQQAEMEQTCQNWLDRYKENPARVIATQNWGGKVTRALFDVLGIKRPQTKSGMLQALAS